MTLYTTAVKRFDTSPALLDMAAIVAASLLIAVSAKVAVPFFPVPMTMQSFMVIGLGLLLGARRGGAAVLLYLAQGAAGFPVFAGTPEKGIGLAYMAGPTGGFLIGLLLAAVLAGWLAERGWDRTPARAMMTALLAGAIIYVPGLLWLGAFVGFDASLLVAGVYPFLPGDIMKALLIALLFPTVWKWCEARFSGR